MSNAKYEQFEAVKPTLLKAVKEVLLKEATPPGERPVDYDICVPAHAMHMDDDEENTAKAVVTYTVHCPTEKKHTVMVKFKYNKLGKIVNDSLSYV